MADFDRSYHHNYSSSYSYNPRLSTDQNQNPPFSLNPSRPSADQTSSYSYSYSYNTSRPSTDQATPYDANSSYEYNGRLDIVPRQQPLPPAVVAPRPVSVVGSSSGPWCFGDPEMKRKRRVANYKAYSVEGKVKSSIRKGFRWIKVKCSEIIHGCFYAKTKDPSMNRQPRGTCLGNLASFFAVLTKAVVILMPFYSVKVEMWV